MFVQIESLQMTLDLEPLGSSDAIEEASLPHIFVDELNDAFLQLTD